MAVTIKDIAAQIRSEVNDAVAEAFEKNRRDAIQRGEGRLPPVGDETKTDDADKPKRAFKGSKVGRVIRYTGIAHKRHRDVLDIAREAGDDEVCAHLEESRDKALASGDLTAGGAMIEGEFSAEFIEALRPRAVYRSRDAGDAGPVEMSMNGGSLTIPYEDTGPSATYEGENQTTDPTEPTFGQLVMRARKLVALTPISNDWLRDDTRGRNDTMLRDSLARALAVREDLAFIEGLGDQATPMGVRGWVDTYASGNTTAANGTVNVANVTTDLNKLLLFVEEGEVVFGKGKWLMHPRSHNYLRSARDGNNNLVWAPELSQGTLMGHSVGVTTQIPKNLGGGSDESRVYFVATEFTRIAEADDIMIDFLPNAAYYDGSAVQAGASNDQSVVRAIARHDHADTFRGKAGAYLSAVTWGA